LQQQREYFSFNTLNIHFNQTRIGLKGVIIEGKNKHVVTVIYRCCSNTESRKKFKFMFIMLTVGKWGGGIGGNLRFISINF